ncbi:MAG: anthranilate phosphoribosyltransferase [Planctomycetota bacterium]
MIEEAISHLVAGKHMTRDMTVGAMEAIMSGQTTPAQTAAFITALAIKGESVEEITGCAEVMREKAVRIRAEEPFVDVVGTGGDKSGTFNISTAAALVVAGAGVRVAKHGNRAASSKSGSADVLAELGVNLEADVPTIERCIAEARFGFMFAPKMHAAMKHAIGPRREIGIRTVFNILGPLTNPAGARNMLLGVFSEVMVEVLASVLRNLGAEHVYVVHGLDGLDEITTTSETAVAELRDGVIKTCRIQPEEFGLPRASLDDLTVEEPGQSAAVIRSVLAGEPGPARDIVVLNAAAGIAAADAAPDLEAAATEAAEAIDSGAAQDALDKLVRISQGT